MKRILSFSVISLFLLTGCSHKINLAEYSPISAPKAKHMPSKEELSNKKPSVLVMDINNNRIEIAQKAKAGEVMATKINGELAASKIVNVVKRLKSTNLEDEVKKIQIMKSLGINNANYIITGKIDNATYNYQFYEAYIYKDKKGRYHRVPPKITYESCVSGNIKVYSLPDLKIKITIPVKACAYQSQDARKPSDAIKYNPSLIRKAAIEAADDAIYPLENFFAPKGYIEEIRKKDDQFIIKVTIGIEDGLKPGDDVYIYTIKDFKNNLTGKIDSEEKMIGKGIVSDNEIGRHYAWIIVDELKEGYILHIGDYVKPHKSQSFFTKLIKAVK